MVELGFQTGGVGAKAQLFSWACEDRLCFLSFTQGSWDLLSFSIGFFSMPTFILDGKLSQNKGVSKSGAGSLCHRQMGAQRCHLHLMLKCFTGIKHAACRSGSRGHVGAGWLKLGRCKCDWGGDLW